MYFSGILLAAGRSTRMGRDKLSLPYGEKTILHGSLSPLKDSPLISEIIVVVNRDSRLAIDQEGCTVAVNKDDHLGMSSSLRTGILAASPLTNAYIVCLADMPRITVGILASLIEAYAETGEGILLPTYRGRDGHPVVLDVAYRERLLQITGDIGAKQIIRDDPDRVRRLPVDDAAVVLDIDTPADWSGDESPVAKHRGSAR